MKHSIDEQILFVGPGERGGIAGVLDTYSTEFHPFKRVITHRNGTFLKKAASALSGYTKLIFRLSTDRKIKIVHIHSASNGSFRRKSIVVTLAKAFGKKVIFHVHGGGFKDFYARNSKNVSSILNRCDLIVCLSDEWKKFFNGIGQTNVEIVNNPILPPVNCPEPNTDGRFHLLYLGLIARSKGVYDLIDAMIMRHRDFSGKLVLHVGGNGETTKLQQLVAEHKLDDIVIIEGWVNGKKKEQLLSNCNALILPSYVEGVPVCLLEAMSYSKPVITTAIGGIPSIVSDRENGIIIPTGSPEAIADAICYLMDNPAISNELGSNGKKISDSYLAPEVAARLRDIYNRLLSV